MHDRIIKSEAWHQSKVLRKFPYKTHKFFRNRNLWMLISIHFNGTNPKFRLSNLQRTKSANNSQPRCDFTRNWFRHTPLSIHTKKNCKLKWWTAPPGIVKSARRKGESDLCTSLIDLARIICTLWWARLQDGARSGPSTKFTLTFVKTCR